MVFAEFSTSSDDPDSQSALKSLQAENAGLKVENNNLKAQLEKTGLKLQLAQEMAQDALKVNQLLSRESKKPPE